MALSEIEKLERRYAENPQGLTFAPLAEVHRKNGNVARALELLTPGLQLHPDYIPASIVLGRCHLDLGDLPAAETAFKHVQGLDGENVIALKALADINERLHHFDEAERWLSQLLSVDRSNDEARTQLERIGTARAQASEVAARAVVSEPSEPQTEIAEPAIEAPVIEPPVEVPALGDLEHTDLAASVDKPPPPGLQVEEMELVEPTVEPVPGLIGRDHEQPAGDEFLVETREDIVLSSSGGAEFQVPDASLELFAAVPPAEPPSFGVETQEPERRETEPFDADAISEPAASEPAASEPAAHAEPEPEPQPELAVEPEPEPEPVAAEAAPVAPVHEELVAQAEPETVVTETMAEVLRVAEPEREPAPARRTFTAAETGGESVATFFQRMLAARPPAGAGAPATHAASSPAPAHADTAGAPTRPAADALSLSSVFGEDTSAMPPAVRAPGAPAGGVSFDEFFSPPGAAPGARAPRSPDAKTDDLDQFHAWLQNLKR